MKKAIVLGVTALLVFLGGSAWLVLYPGVLPDLDGVENQDGVAQAVSIPVGEGDHLAAWLLPDPGSRTERPGAVVVLLAGYRRDHRTMWRYGLFLRRAGWTVLAVDFRSARARSRKPTTLGYWELIDARATLDWLRQQPKFRRADVALFGESLGGSVALALAAERPDVDAVIADCPFSSGKAAIEDGFACELGIPAWPLAPICRGLGRLVTGHDPGALDVSAALRGLGERPVLLIQTTREDHFSRRQVRALAAASGPGTVRWTLDDVDHTGAWYKHREDYESRVRRFLSRHLRRGP